MKFCSNVFARSPMLHPVLTRHWRHQPTCITPYQTECSLSLHTDVRKSISASF